MKPCSSNSYDNEAANLSQINRVIEKLNPPKVTGGP